MVYTKGFEKVWYAWAQHKVESKAWSCLVDLPPIAMECVALCARCCAHLAIWKLYFPESGKFGSIF